MISLCVPTRGRPERFAEMLASAKATALGRFEVCAWLDDDDPRRDDYPRDPLVKYASGPRPWSEGVLYTSGLWDKAWAAAEGDIAMLAADDIIFCTQGWDTWVKRAFARVPDRILMIYADDGTARKRPVLPFVSREWIDAAGFTPHDFQGWFADTWIWTIAAELPRVRFLPDVLIRHDQRRRSDQTYRDGEKARDAEGGALEIRKRFYNVETIRRRDFATEALRRVMDPDLTYPAPDPVPPWLIESLMKTAWGRGKV